jgi:chromosome partitioning protein
MTPPSSPAAFRVLALLSRKGGSGKTTLATHLAVAFGTAGRRVMLIDCDAQASASAWAGLRDADAPTLMQSLPEGLRDALAAARRAGVTLAVVDSAPGVGPAITPIAKAADLVLVPCRPSVLDLFAINQTVATIKSARVPAGIVLNACPARRGAGEASVTVDARRALADYGLPILAPTIGERVSLRHALSAGLAVTEFDPNGRAAKEIAALAAFVEQRLWPSP